MSLSNVFFADCFVMYLIFLLFICFSKGNGKCQMFISGGQLYYFSPVLAYSFVNFFTLPKILCASC